MEPHIHPHVHHDKKWKDYLFEFLMLFLAVSAGFFMENFREHHAEKERAKEYAQLLINDFSTDLNGLNGTTNVLNRIVTSGDSLARLISANDIKKIPGGKLYYYEYWSGWRWRVTSRNATLKQLESSGALRYLGNALLIKKILDYEESLKIITLLEDNYAAEKTENWILVQKVFDQNYFNLLDNIKAAARDSSAQISQDDSIRLNTFLHTNYPLITYDKSMLMQLSNWGINSSRSYRTLISTVEVAKQKAAEAINALKKEYHFK